MTPHRDDYVATLRRLSRANDPDPFVRCLQRLQTATVSTQASTRHETIERWASTNAFMDERDAKLRDVDPTREIVWNDGGIPMARDVFDEMERERQSNAAPRIIGLAE